MAEKPDFMIKMLAGMVGIEPEEFQRTIEQFIHTAQSLGAQMNRVEYNTIQLLKAENERRGRHNLNCSSEMAKQPFLNYYDTDGNLTIGLERTSETGQHG